jgi:hypothetical protein
VKEKRVKSPKTAPPQRLISKESVASAAASAATLTSRPRDLNFKPIVKKRVKEAPKKKPTNDSASEVNIEHLKSMIRKQNNLVAEAVHNETDDEPPVVCQKENVDSYHKNLDHLMTSSGDDHSSDDGKRPLNGFSDTDNDDEEAIVLKHSPDLNDMRTPWTRKLLTIYKRSFVRFIHSPRVIFFYEIFFFSTFLLIYSYWLLVKLNYYEWNEGGGRDREPVGINQSDNSMKQSNQTISLFKKRGKVLLDKEEIAARMKPPAFVEYLLVYWVTMFMVEEFVQVSGLYW